MVDRGTVRSKKVGGDMKQGSTKGAKDKDDSNHARAKADSAASSLPILAHSRKAFDILRSEQS